MNILEQLGLVQEQLRRNRMRRRAAIIGFLGGIGLTTGSGQWQLRE